MGIRVVVLGAAAGGGFPQWNSDAPGCRRARAGDPAAKPRTQTGLAVSADGRRWFLLNAAPDLSAQIERTPVLHPQGGGRASPIAGVVLTNGDVDALAGLLSLRERHVFALHATAQVMGVIDANPIFNVLDRSLVTRHAQPVDMPFALDDALTARLVPVPGKIPLYLEGEAPPPPVEDGTTTGLFLSAAGRTLAFVPSCAAMIPALLDRLMAADLVFFDGTLWRDDEMIAAGLGPKTGRRMGHMSLDGPDGTLAALAGLPGRRILIHINNSNPVLLADTPERRAAEAAGWTIAHDGLEIAL